jgi:NAD(P)-dependent dehydrogenase (short-subunit alcohol dehydrogenase family)
MKNIIITGAAGNLGSAVVKNFLANNYRVIPFVSMRDKTSEIKVHNKEAIPLDLTDEEACKNQTENIAKKYGSIDAAVLTAGSFIPGDIEHVSKYDFEKMIAINFITAFNMAQPVFLQMKKQKEGGKIIFIGSGPGEDGAKAAKSVAYGFSKSLLFRLAELINSEGNKINISAEVIIPTTIDTPQNREAMPTADFSKWMSAESIAEEIYLAVK